MDWLWNWTREQLTSWTMSKVYVTCALLGGTVLVLQVLLSLLGVGGDAEVDDPDIAVDDVGDAGDGADPGLNVLSVRAVAGFLTFFGLVGWGGHSSGWSPILTAFLAFLAGMSVMLLVASVMRVFRRLTSSGNVDPKEAIGLTATVYLRIPPRHSGRGKITVGLQGRSLEFLAVTAGDEIPTGRTCRILGLTTDDTFEVEALD